MNAKNGKMTQEEFMKLDNERTTLIMTSKFKDLSEEEKSRLEELNKILKDYD